MVGEGPGSSPQTALVRELMGVPVRPLSPLHTHGVGAPVRHLRRGRAQSIGSL